MERETAIIAEGARWPASKRGGLFGVGAWRRRAAGAPACLVAVALLAAVAGGGCAVRVAPPTGEVAFDLRGRFSVVQDGHATAGNFFWRQFVGGFELDLWGPLGQGRARLIGAGGSLSLVNARGEAVADGNAEALMRRELGWSAPLDAFAAWVTGRPAPDWPAQVHGDGSFEQLGWRVEVKSWRDVGAQTLPRRLEASRPGTRIVVVCREWGSPPMVSAAGNDAAMLRGGGSPTTVDLP